MFDNTALFGFSGTDADDILEYLMEKDIDVRDVLERRWSNHRPWRT